MTALTDRPEPDLDFAVATRVDIPAPQFRVLAKHARDHDLTVNAVIAELVRLSITPTPAPRTAPTLPVEPGKPTGRLATALAAAKAATPAHPTPAPAAPRVRRDRPTPKSRTHRLDAVKDQFAADCAAGLRDHQLATKYDAHITTISAWRRKLGITASLGRTSAMDTHKADLIRLHADGLTDRQIGTALNVNSRTIQHWRTLLNLPANAVGRPKATS
jgi:transposase